MDPNRSSAAARSVLLFVEDDGLGELFDEALSDAGHLVTRARDDDELRRALLRQRFDSVIVDLDDRARRPAVTLAQLRAAAPATAVVALLPCSAGLDGRSLGYDAALEKPARLAALLAAVQTRRNVQ